MSAKAYQVIDIIHKTTDYLKKKGIENARLNAELLIGFVLKLDRVQLYLNFEKLFLPAEIEKLKIFLRRRAAHEPIQYILGETEFYSLKFKVNHFTLIPRPETELLVEKTLEICNKDFENNQTINILDIGTGSGNIATALVKNNINIFVTAIDINSAALELAEENAKLHRVADRISFLHQNIFKNFPKEFLHFDLIVSNPPYVKKQELAQLPPEVKDFEPLVALDGGENGLKYYFRICELAPLLLKNRAGIVIEIGAFQSKQVVDIFYNCKLFQHVEVINDLNGISRVILAKK